MGEGRPGAVARRKGAVFLALIAVGCGPLIDHPPEISEGVSLGLARYRSAGISDVRYDLRFSIPGLREEPVVGRARISFLRRRRHGPVVLDFDAPRGNVRAVRAGDVGGTLSEPEWEFREDHLVIPASVFRGERAVVEVEFAAGDGPLNRSPESLYTLFVPDRAHRVFPCFDQPDLKARFRLTLSVPEGWTAVANGALLPDSGNSDGVFRFEETAPIPTYLFSFAAGLFEIEEAERGGRSLRFYHRETDAAKVARNREAIFDLHFRALAWLEDYTGIPYPFGKLDFVLVPSFPYSGMEHPGAILYRAESLLLDESATKLQELGRASVIAHETAHMWFGDLVTMRWFDDVWLKEVFANFFAAKIVAPAFPEVDHDLRFVLAHHPVAYAVDRSAGTHPIRQELSNLREAGSLYGAIIYQKAPIVMRQLELLLGAEELREGLRAYLERHAFSNASWTDLVETLDRLTGENLARWSHVWVEEAGRPTVRLSVGRERGQGGDGGGLVARVAASDPAGRGRVWPQRLELLWVGGDSAVRRPIRLSGEEVRLAFSGSSPLRFAHANGAGLGYGFFPLDPRSRRYLLARYPGLGPGDGVPRRMAVPRAVTWLSLWDEMVEGTISPSDLLSTALRALGEEPDELLASRVAADLGVLYWRFLGAAARREAAPAVEAVLWNRLETAETTSARASFFEAYRTMALSPRAVARLVRVWGGAETIPGLPLSERDRMSLALELAVREVSGSGRILAEQAARIRDPERKRRFEFVAPAVSADPAVRAGFFERLREPRNREREPWVLEGVAYLHHPLRAHASLRFLRPALEMLEEIQQTGDIFFPRRWLDATLGGHSSTEAAEEVRRFLAEHPDLPPPLRGKVLQAADLLFRAASRQEGGAGPGQDGERR